MSMANVLRTIIFTAVILFSGCFTPSESSRYDKIADQYCACTTKLAALNQQVMTEHQDSVAQEAFHNKLQEIQEEYANVRDCSAAIIAQFGALQEADYPEIEKKLALKCPELAQQRDLLREMLGE